MTLQSAWTNAELGEEQEQEQEQVQVQEEHLANELARFCRRLSRGSPSSMVGSICALPLCTRMIY